MKVHTIEIAEAIEAEFRKFLKDWGGDYPMRFTRFVDLGGRRTDLYAYTASKDAQPWMLIRIKAVFMNDQGECVQYSVEVAGKEVQLEEVLVSPEIWKIPALTDKILTFAKNEMLVKIAESGDALASGSAGQLESGGSSASDDEEDDEDIDTSGILASDDDSSGGDFDPSSFIANANKDDETG